MKQLNYDSTGAIDGFLFTGGTTLFVSTGSRSSATLKPLLIAGTTVSVTGTTSPASAVSACVATGNLTAVDASSLIVGGQTIVLAGGNAHGSH